MKKHIKKSYEIRQIESIKEDIREIKKAIGYVEFLFNMGFFPTLKKPSVSISEKVDKVCEHLGIKIEQTAPEIKVRKKK